MARYSAEQIYAFARAAGFDPDGAATMTAVALAESSGNSTAHASLGEDSRGLWQINARAHHDLAAKYDLWDPRDNAKAAFEVSHEGRDISPWTTTHGGARASYLRYRDDAQSAAVGHGDPDGLGVWSGTRGYGHSLAASPHAGHAGAGNASADDSAGAVHTTMAGAPGARSGAEIDGGFVPLGPDRGAADGAGPDAAGQDAALPESSGEGPATGQDLGSFAPLEPERPGPAGGADAEESPNSADTGSADTGSAAAGQQLGAFAALDDRSGTAAATGATPNPVAAAATAPTATADGHDGSSRLDTFMDSAQEQKGDAYVFGAPVKLSDPDPSAFDCSELIRWAANRADVEMPDGSWLQYLHLQEEGALIPVSEARHTRGAILFSFSSEPTAGGARPSHAHVAISDGDGGTIEARGRAYGVGNFESEGRFNYAAVIPEFRGGGSGGGGSRGGDGGGSRRGDDSARGGAAGEAASGAAIDGAFAPATVIDTDADSLPDDLEARLHTDPFRSDTDGDSVRDSLEIIYTHTDPLSADPREALDAALDAALAQILGTESTLDDGSLDGPLDSGTGTGDGGPGDDGTAGGVQAAHTDHETGQRWARDLWAEPESDDAHDPARDAGSDPAADAGSEAASGSGHEPGSGQAYEGGWATGSGWETGAGWEQDDSGHHA